MTTPRTITIEIHVAIDSRCQWFAWGSGTKDDSDFRDESIALFNANAPGLNHTDKLGNDAADVEHFTVFAEIPIPDHVVWASRVQRPQQEFFTETAP